MGMVTTSAVLVLLCLGAVGLNTAGAGRTHESFATSSYNPDSLTQSDVPLRDLQASQLPAAQYSKDEATIPNRYPNGYPSTTYQYDPKTSSYNAVDKRPTSGAGYTHGYYQNSQYSAEADHLPATTDTIPDRYPQGYYAGSHNIGNSNSWVPYKADNGAKFSSESLDQSQHINPDQTLGERYPRGYYPDSQYTSSSHSATPDNPSEFKQYNGASYSSTQSSVDPAGERYPHGYYPNSQFTSNPSAFSQQQFNGGYYSAQTTNEQQPTTDPAGERYPHGYYPNAQYTADRSQSSYTGTFDQYTGARHSAQPMNEQQQNSNAAEGERYPQGYYPSAQYSLSGSSEPKPVTQAVSYSSYQGNFNTLPYSNNIGELPYEQTGAGCRTAYWVANVDKWPKFFNVRSTVADAFGTKTKEVYGETTILQALMNYGTDAYNELGRSGCTALLNAYSRGGYALAHTSVIEQFNAALVSKEAATAQAVTFETANVESISAGNPCT